MSDKRRLLMLKMAKKNKVFENKGTVINYEDLNIIETQVDVHTEWNKPDCELKSASRTLKQVSSDFLTGRQLNRSVIGSLHDDIIDFEEANYPAPKRYTELQPVVRSTTSLPELNKDDLMELNDNVQFSDSISLRTEDLNFFDINLSLPFENDQNEIIFRTPQNTDNQQKHQPNKASTPIRQPSEIILDPPGQTDTPNIANEGPSLVSEAAQKEKSFEKSIDDLIHQLSSEDFSTSSVHSKTKKKVTSKRERDPAKRLEIERKKYTLKPPCKKLCRKKCHENFTKEERIAIWSNFRGLSKQDQRNFISRQVKKSKKTISTKENSRRNNTLSWSLRNTKVCKVFFLNTLGFKNDQTVVTVLKANFKHRIINNDEVPAAPEQRGQSKPWNSFPASYKQDVKEYIEKIRPTVSHYNLSHAPNRRYLPCGVSFTDLYKSYLTYCDEENIRKCSWAYFHGIINEMNLSTSTPKQDICTLCRNHEESHNESNHDCSECDCKACKLYPMHIKNRNLSRASLDNDMKEEKDSVKIFTADMQKAICMPKLTTKDYFFSRKLVLFNETFVSPGKNELAFCIVWHEGESGRKAYNIASSYVYFIINYAKDIEEIIIYCDNCTAQNKNRILFTAMIRLINSEGLINAKKIRFVYLEPGHTYMAADAVHACITNKFARQKNMYDLKDYVNTMRASRKNILVQVMTHDDMMVFSDQLKKNIFPKNYNIQSLKMIEFRRGSTHMFVKKEYDEEEFKDLDVLRKNVLNTDKSEFLSDVPREAKKRGISKEKKIDLIKLCDSLPRAFRKFYEDLEEDNVVDLDENIDN